MSSISFSSMDRVVVNGYLSATGDVSTTKYKNAIGQITGVSGTDVSLKMLSFSKSGITFGSGAAGVTWNITGTNNNDYIILDGSGTVSGGAGNDTLKAVGANAEVLLSGGAGADSLVVGSTASGNVSLQGGAGADVFMLSTQSTATVTFVDYNAAEGDKIYGVTVSAAEKSDPTVMGQLITSDGVLTIPGTSAKAQLKTKGDGYYAAYVEGIGMVYAGGEKGTSVNASAETQSVTVIGNNNDVGDVLRGGSAKDTIYVGATDSVLGGRGDDSIIIATTTDSTSIGFSDVANAGTDTLQSAVLGFGDTATHMYMANGTLGVNFKGAKLDTMTGTLTLNGKDGSLVVTSATATDGTANASTNIVMQDKTGTYNTTVFQGTYEATTKDATVYYATSSGNAMLDFSGVSDDMVVDLTGTGFGGDTSVYYNINRVKAGNSASGTVVMVGSSNAKNTLEAAGAQTSLWGGSGSQDDSLIGGTGKDFFALGTKGGSDKVAQFTAGSEAVSDVVYVLAKGISGVKKNTTGDVTFSLADGSALTLQNNDSLTDDAKIGFSTSGDQADTYGKISSGAGAFTYEGDVGAYVSGKSGGSIAVSTTEAATVWLDGAEGVAYQNITRVDGSSNTGDLILGGTSASKETLIGGAGSNTLWGGAGDDTLVGGSGANTFYVGVNEGKDVITGANASDKVMLYNLASTDVKSVNVKNGNLVVEFTNGGGFTVNDYANGPATYEFTDTSFSREDLMSSNS
ncbi:MAG: hypothetical protein IJT01_12585 [Selenomonadaceae bacterium]|nr:hypothetical protein [Selenomonadaceae bacterium]